MPHHRKVLNRIVRKVPAVDRVFTERNDLRRVVGILETEKQQLMNDTRLALSHKYIRGKGVEIGALHMPLSLHPDAKVKYIDYLPVNKLRQQYPGLKDLPLVDVDIVDDGEKLSKVKDASLDFIIANHFLEHCLDPITTLLNFYKKLRGNGLIYMAIPDKRYTFDMFRPLTSYAHLMHEHRINPSKKFYIEHCREVVKLTHGVKKKKEIEDEVQSFADMNYSIHHHVWTQKELVEFFYKTAEKLSLDIEIEAMASNVHEVIFVIRKLDPHKELAKVRSIQKHYFGSNSNFKSRNGSYEPVA